MSLDKEDASDFIDRVSVQVWKGKGTINMETAVMIETCCGDTSGLKMNTSSLNFSFVRADTKISSFALEKSILFNNGRIEPHGGIFSPLCFSWHVFKLY